MRVRGGGRPFPRRDAGDWIAKLYWDRGFGTDAVRTACRFGFREMNLKRISLSVYQTNPRGQRAYQKVGFTEEGQRRRAEFVDGHPVDVIEMGLLVEDLIEAQPTEAGQCFKGSASSVSTAVATRFAGPGPCARATSRPSRARSAWRTFSAITCLETCPPW